MENDKKSVFHNRLPADYNTGRKGKSPAHPGLAAAGPRLCGGGKAPERRRPQRVEKLDTLQKGQQPRTAAAAACRRPSDDNAANGLFLLDFATKLPCAHSAFGERRFLPGFTGTRRGCRTPRHGSERGGSWGSGCSCPPPCAAALWQSRRCCAAGPAGWAGRIPQ